MSNKLENPYEHHPQWSNDIRRFPNKIPREDVELVLSILPEKGTLQAVSNHLWKKLCNELRKRKITTTFQRDEFIKLVVESELTTNGSDSLQRSAPKRGPKAPLH